MKVLLKRNVGFSREMVAVNGYIRPSGSLIMAEVVAHLDRSTDGFDYIVKALDEFGIEHEFLVTKNEVKAIH